MEYYCPEKSCAFDGNDPYVFKITAEAYMDVHNMAVIYCPHCLTKMIKREKENIISGGKE